jgi:deleted-in-malignant-brain-tumors protein 1
MYLYTITCYVVSLGFEGALSALPRSAFDQADRNLSIYLDDVHCLGDEPALSYCIHNGIGVHNCGHYEDASVICQGTSLVISS